MQQPAGMTGEESLEQCCAEFMETTFRGLCMENISNQESVGFTLHNWTSILVFGLAFLVVAFLEAEWVGSTIYVTGSSNLVSKDDDFAVLFICIQRYLVLEGMTVDKLGRIIGRRNLDVHEDFAGFTLGIV